MFVVIVQAHVKKEAIQAFIEATQENASNSIKEPGIARFDVYQQADDPTRFTLIEIYRSETGPENHRNSEHYARWRETVEGLMIEPRTKTICNIIFPHEIE